MMSATGMTMAAIVVMLWILWSDTMRRRPPVPILYAVRIALYLILGGILVTNAVRYPHIFSPTDRVLVAVAVVIALVGAGYFGRRLVTRT